MLQFRRWLILGLALACLAGCASSLTQDIAVETEANPEVDFGAHQTFAWLGAATEVDDPDGIWTPPQLDVMAEVRFLVNRELRKRGMSEVVASPDVEVLCAIGVDMNALELVQDPQTLLELAENIPKAALVVTLVDPATRTPIWLGIAVATLQEDPSNDLVKKRVHYAVSEILKGLPR